MRRIALIAEDRGGAAIRRPPFVTTCQAAPFDGPGPWCQSSAGVFDQVLGRARKPLRYVLRHCGDVKSPRICGIMILERRALGIARLSVWSDRPGC